MARKPRLHYPEALAHVIARGNNRQNIFLDRNDFQTFIRYLTHVKERRPFKLHAYCLMPNHFHLLVGVEEIPLSVIMHRLLTSYTQFFNRKHRRIGHLLQGRYKAILCERDSYLLELVRYIHLNPVRARLVKTALEWEWSGHRAYLGQAKSTVIDTRGVLEHFPGNKSVRESYRDFVRDGMLMGKRSDLYPPEHVPFLGEEKFVNDLKIKHLEVIENKTPTRKSKGQSLTDILKRVAQENQMPTQLIQSTSRLRSVVGVRRVFIIQANGAGHKISDIARFLGCSIALLSKVVGEYDNKVNEAVASHEIRNQIS